MASFRARARTVDLLGRQQIAGIPTAISELFKNAHDAYATRVEVDFYRAANLLILRDDGLGMTRADFEAARAIVSPHIYKTPMLTSRRRAPATSGRLIDSGSASSLIW